MFTVVNCNTIHSTIKVFDHLGHQDAVNDNDSLISTASFWKAFNYFISDFDHIYSLPKYTLLM